MLNGFPGSCHSGGSGSSSFKSHQTGSSGYGSSLAVKAYDPNLFRHRVARALKLLPEKSTPDIPMAALTKLVTSTPKGKDKFALILS
jgi:hypothetical protein